MRQDLESTNHFQVILLFVRKIVHIKTCSYVLPLEINKLKVNLKHLIFVLFKSNFIGIQFNLVFRGRTVKRERKKSRDKGVFNIIRFIVPCYCNISILFFHALSFNYSKN